MLEFAEDADAELSRLEHDSSKSELVDRITRVLAQLGEDPTNERLRRIRFSNGLWGVGIRDRDDDYLILWDGQDLPETVTVVYVGLLPHR